jgi:hypothetical protein
MMRTLLSAIFLMSVGAMTFAAPIPFPKSAQVYISAGKWYVRVEIPEEIPSTTLVDFHNDGHCYLGDIKGTWKSSGSSMKISLGEIFFEASLTRFSLTRWDSLTYVGSYRLTEVGEVRVELVRKEIGEVVK